MRISRKIFDFLNVLHTASAKNFIDGNFKHSKCFQYLCLLIPFMNS